MEDIVDAHEGQAHGVAAGLKRRGIGVAEAPPALGEAIGEQGRDPLVRMAPFRLVEIARHELWPDHGADVTVEKLADLALEELRLVITQKDNHAAPTEDARARAPQMDVRQMDDAILDREV